MRSVRLFDYLQYDGQTWQVVAQDGPELALKALISGRIRRIGVAELLGDDSFLPDSPDRLPSLDSAAVLETLDPPARERVLFLHRHVVEVLTGATPANLDGDDQVDAAVARPEYDPKLPLRDRIGAKVAELETAGTPLGYRSLERYIKSYRTDGLVGLADGRRQRQISGTGRIDPALVSLLEEAVRAQTNISTGTRSRLIKQVSLEAAGLGLEVPSRSTLYRAVDNLDKGRHAFGNATTRRTQANQPDRTWGRQAPLRPGELVEIDSTPMDLMVIYPDGSTGRVDLSITLDIATRTLCSRDSQANRHQERRCSNPSGPGTDSPADAARLVAQLSRQARAQPMARAKPPHALSPSNTPHSPASRGCRFSPRVRLYTMNATVKCVAVHHANENGGGLLHG